MSTSPFWVHQQKFVSSSRNVRLLCCHVVQFRVFCSFSDQAKPACPTRTVDQLQRRKFKLKQLLDKIQWPKAVPLLDLGKERNLLAASDSCPFPRSSPTLEDLDYAVGFLDGDGCVAPKSNLSNCELRITQSIAHAEVLLWFRNQFGGGIYIHSNGRGAKKPSLFWCSHSCSVKQVAAILSSRPGIKAEQLVIASKWPKLADERLEMAYRLKNLHHTPPKHQIQCSWSYLAGFFDAEGCIRIPAKSSSIHLLIAQKHNMVLTSLKSFLNHESNQDASYITEHGGASYLNVTQSQQSRLILERLLLSGLKVKRDAAKLAMSLGTASHASVRVQMQGLVGNQNRYQTLDEEGCQRAREIAALQQKLRRAQRSSNHAALEELGTTLSGLKQVHVTQTAEASILMLHRDIRHLLQCGGTVKRGNQNKGR